MKKAISFVLAFAMVLSVAVVAFAEAKTGSGEARGFGGNVTVALTVEDGKIVAADITGDSETEGIGKAAIPVLAEAMLKDSTIDVDGVAGATVTSTAVKAAAADALAAAGLTAADLASTKAEAEETAYVAAFDQPDVIVVGAGGSGIIAAITAAESGAKVYLYEKTGVMGGSNNYSGGSLSAAGTKMQEEAGIVDDPANFAADMLRMGGGTNIEELTITHVNNAVAAVDWVDALGVDLGDRIPTMSASYDAFNVPRQYMMWLDGKQTGKGLLSKIIPLVQSYEQDGKVAIFMNTEVSDIIIDENGAVTGVVVGGENVAADAVILATGGYGHSEELVKRYNFKNAVSTAPEFATGDGYIWAEKAGAQFSNMDYCPGYVGAVPVNSGTFSKTVGVNSNYEPAIWVNLDGVRACAELGGLDSQKKHMYEVAPENLVFYVFNQEARDSRESIISGDDAEWSKFEELLAAEDCVYMGATVEELAAKTGINAEALVATIAQYNASCEKGEDEAFGRTPETLVSMKEGPYYAVKSCPSVLLTKGGPLMNSNAQIINTEGNPIVGLYQCGEIVGGANIGGSASIGGLANTINVVWGKIAGSNAAAFALSK